MAASHAAVARLRRTFSPVCATRRPPTWPTNGPAACTYAARRSPSLIVRRVAAPRRAPRKMPKWWRWAASSARFKILEEGWFGVGRGLQRPIRGPRTYLFISVARLALARGYSSIKVAFGAPVASIGGGVAAAQNVFVRTAATEPKSAVRVNDGGATACGRIRLRRALESQVGSRPRRAS